MRVPNITTYSQSTYFLGNLTSDLQGANEVVSTQKQIIEISDDPVGLNQVLTLKNSLGNLQQIEQNVTLGKSWLEIVENALDNVNNLILETKTEVTRLANDSTTANERLNAIARVNDIMEQIVTLGNTQVNGSYVFSGTDSNIKPFEFDPNGYPEQVIYKGNDIPFEIRTDKNSGVEVGRDGEKTFWDDEIKINELNNTIVFKEDLGRGSTSQKTLTAVIPDGEYTPETLSQAIRNALNSTSEESGYQVNYLVDYDVEQKTYTIQADGSHEGFLQTTFLWENGGDAYLNEMTAGNGIDPDDLDIQVNNKKALTIATTKDGETKPLRFVWDGDANWIVEDNPGYIIPAKIQGTALGFDVDLDESGAPDISVKLENSALAEGAYVEFEIIPEKGDFSVGHEIGFSGSNTISTPPVSDTQAQFVTNLIITSGINDKINFVEKGTPSVIASGTVLDADYTVALNLAVTSGTLIAGSTLASGSVIVSGTTLGAGTIIGSGIPLVSDFTIGRTLSGISSGTLISGSSLGSGSILGSGSVLSAGTTMGSGSIIGSGTILTADVVLGQSSADLGGGLLQSGSSLTSGTILGAGTQLNSGTIIGSGTVLTGDFQLDSDVTASHGGVLTAGSFVASGSILLSGTVLASGEQISLVTGLDSGSVTGDGVSSLATLANATTMGAAASYTVISGGDILNQGILTLDSGSMLAYGTASGIAASGSVFASVQITTASGVTLDSDMTLNGSDMVLTSDTTLVAGTTILAGSTLLSGSFVDDVGIVNSDNVLTLASNMTLKGVSTLNGPAANNVLGGDLTLVSGTTIATDSFLLTGSFVDDGAITTGSDTLLDADVNVTGSTGIVLGGDMIVLTGTVIAVDSILELGSVVNRDLPIDSAQIIAAGTVFPADYGTTTTVVLGSGTLASGTDFIAGSTIVSGSILGAGTVFGSGTVLTADFQVATDIVVADSGLLTAGSFVPSGSTLTAGTILASGEQMNLSNASGTTDIISGDGLSSLAALASGTLGVEASYITVSGDTLSDGIGTLTSGSILLFSTSSGLVTSGSTFAGSQFTTSSGSTLNADMNVVGQGVTLGDDMTVLAGTTLGANSVIAQGSSIDVTITTGGTSGELTATITAGDYTDMDALCLEIKTQLDNQSANKISYAVSYDPVASLFNIREDGTTLEGLDLLWKTGANSNTSLGSTLGYYTLDDALTYPGTDTAPVHCSITIDDTNDTLDFEEVNGVGVASGTIRAFISHGTYTDMAELLNEIEASMEAVSDNGIDYEVSYDNLGDPKLTIQSQAGALNELRLFNDSGVDSIKETLGFDAATTGYTSYDSTNAPVLMEFTSDNNKIDFQEKDSAGILSDQINIEIPNGSYSNLDDVAVEIQNALREDSPNQIEYEVSYDFGTGKFVIKGSDADLSSFSLLWETGKNSSESAAELLGIDPTQDDVMVFSESDKEVVNITIDAFNNKIDFQEIVSGSEGKSVDNLTASIESKTYTSYPELVQEIEEALERESHNNGNDIKYSVSWDEQTHKFSIKENGTQLEEFRLLWQSGDNAPTDQGGTGFSIGSVIGFDGNSDDVKTPLSSHDAVNWGVFNTLIDLKEYLADNDRNGIERTLGRLETNYGNMTSRIVDTGMKYSRLEIRETITTQMNLSLTERKSIIEDADIVESIMKLQNLTTSYQAALSSTAKVMNLSLLDYL